MCEFIEIHVKNGHIPFPNCIAFEDVVIRDCLLTRLAFLIPSPVRKLVEEGSAGATWLN
jgi:hypothetical protein